MGDFLIVSLAEELQAYEDLAQEYQVGFEINDFYDPLVFEDKKRREDIIQKYQKAGIPAGSTMHGAFYDVSRDLKTSYATEHGDCPRTFGERGCIPHKLESDAF